MISGMTRASRLIRGARNIAISGHVNPDGDSIGSMLGLSLGLERMRKRVQMVSCDGIPHRYRRLPGASRIVAKAEGPIDLAIAVDCGSKEMLGSTLSSFMGAAELLEIDHHGFRRPFGTASLIDHDAAAVGELVFGLLRALNVRLTRQVSQNLMTSIIVETNSFRLPNVRPLTLEICADLIKHGVDFHKLVETVFWSKRSQTAILSGICLSRCAFLKGGRVVWSIVRREDLDAVRGNDDDVDAVPDEMRSIDDVRVAVLFREDRSGRLRVSLRSRGKINVAALAESYGGGGHSDVAGCTIDNRPRVIKAFLGKAGRLVD